MDMGYNNLQLTVARVSVAAYTFPQVSAEKTKGAPIATFALNTVGLVSSRLFPGNGPVFDPGTTARRPGHSLNWSFGTTRN